MLPSNVMINNSPSAWWPLTCIWTLCFTSEVIDSSVLAKTFHISIQTIICKLFMNGHIHLWNFFILERIVILWCISVEFGSKAGWEISKPSDFTISRYLEKEDLPINQIVRVFPKWKYVPVIKQQTKASQGTNSNQVKDWTKRWENWTEDYIIIE